MSVAEAQAWAAKLTPSGMERKLQDLEVWVVELDGTVAGWGAIQGDRLEGLYAAPEFAGQVGRWGRIARFARRADAQPEISFGAC